jgi:hypothetical protein
VGIGGITPSGSPSGNGISLFLKSRMVFLALALILAAFLLGFLRPLGLRAI